VIILILAMEYPPMVGGGGTYTHNLAKGLAKNGAQIVLVTSGKRDLTETVNKNLTIKRFRVFEDLYLGKGNIIEGINILVDQVKKIGPDILQTHHSVESLIGKIANLNFGLPHFIVHHKTPEYQNRLTEINGKWSLHSFVNQHTNNNPRFIALSKAYKECLLQHEVSKNLITIIYPGVDTSIFKRVNPLLVTQLKRKLGLDNDTVILVPTKIRKRKGIDFLTNSLSGFSIKSKKIKLIITGLSENGMDNFKKIVKERIKPVELIEHDGFSSEEMPVLYNLASVTVLPSKAEGLGMAILEAMACGCPVIGTNVMGINEVIKNGYNGTLIPFGNANRLKESIKEIVRNRSVRNKYIKNGYKTLKEKFNLDLQARRHMELYSRVITGQKHSAGGVLYKKNGGKFQVYLAKHKEYGYVLPKGGKENKETWIETAAREVLEETGYSVAKPGYPLGTIEYSFEKDGQTYHKEVRFFAFEVPEKVAKGDLSLEEGENITEGRWFDFKEATSKMAHQSEKDIVNKLFLLLSEQSNHDH
jgi:glycosyltransferase involved in cell wall biosynthesis/ADP-ribose pyrophosphatase YjhB (NUDIX family)